MILYVGGITFGWVDNYMTGCVIDHVISGCVAG